jgi:hypothetical protein
MCTRYLLLPLLLLALPVIAVAGPNENAKIVGHLASPVLQKTICKSAPVPPCNPEESHLNTRGEVGRAYDLYLLVVDGDSGVGFAAATFGISYAGGEGIGLDVRSWTPCAKQYDTPGPAWPDSGSTLNVLWNRFDDCQGTPAPGDRNDGVTATLGALYVYAYGEDVFQITGNSHQKPGGACLVSCSMEPSHHIVVLPERSLGKVGFGNSGGYDPCR